MTRYDLYYDPEAAASKEIFEHSEKGYWRGCRCRTCTDAWATYCHENFDARRNRPIPPDMHGRENCYINYGCRRPECRAATMQARRERKALRG